MLVSVKQIGLDGGDEELALRLNMTYDDMLDDIRASVRYSETAYDATRQVSTNYKLSPYLAKDLFDILQDKVIYQALKNG